MATSRTTWTAFARRRREPGLRLRGDVRVRAQHLRDGRRRHRVVRLEEAPREVERHRLAGVEVEDDRPRVPAEGRAVVEQEPPIDPHHLPRREPLLVEDVPEDLEHQVLLGDPAVARRVADDGDLALLIRGPRREHDRRGEPVAGALLDHYTDALVEIHEKGYLKYWATQLRPYLRAAALNFSPGKLTATERFLSPADKLSE